MEAVGSGPLALIIYLCLYLFKELLGIELVVIDGAGLFVLNNLVRLIVAGVIEIIVNLRNKHYDNHCQSDDNVCKQLKVLFPIIVHADADKKQFCVPQEGVKVSCSCKFKACQGRNQHLKEMSERCKLIEAKDQDVKDDPEHHKIYGISQYLFCLACSYVADVNKNHRDQHNSQHDVGM